MIEHYESTKPESSKMSKCFSSSSFFRWLAQVCMNLSQWFMHETAAFYTEQCTTPSLLIFSTLKSLMVLVTTHSENYGCIWDTIFFICMHAQISINTILLLKIAEVEMHSVCLGMGSKPARPSTFRSTQELSRQPFSVG